MYFVNLDFEKRKVMKSENSRKFSNSVCTQYRQFDRELWPET